MSTIFSSPIALVNSKCVLLLAVSTGGAVMTVSPSAAGGTEVASVPAGFMGEEGLDTA
jgi:hypothetical protein